MPEHVRVIRLFEQELINFEKRKRIHAEKLGGVLVAISGHQGFTLRTLFQHCIDERKDVYDRFGPSFENRGWRCHKTGEII